MHILTKVLTGLVTSATAVSLGLPGPAHAAVPALHLAVMASLRVTPSTVPAGVVTGVSLMDPCPDKVKPSSVTGLPAPDGSTTDLQVVVSFAEPGDDPPAIIILGVWPAPGPASYTIRITCPGGQTGTATVTVESAPAPNDVVGVGSDTIQNVMDAFSSDYNSSPPPGSTGNLYSWDATNPVTGAIGDPITTKTGCNPIPRPDGSSAGITALVAGNGTTSGHPCIDFAGSSRPRGSTDPACSTGGICFVSLAGDGVTYATQMVTNAPSNLSTADLTGIYTCTLRTWNQAGGTSDATIDPFLPQPGSGTRSFFLAAIGVSTPGSCVSDGNGLLQENEGVNPVLDDPNAIVPYSIGSYIGQSFSSAGCLSLNCSASGSGVICSPASGQNLFGCDTHGTMVVNKVDGTAPIAPANPGITWTINPGGKVWEGTLSGSVTLADLGPGNATIVCTKSTVKIDLTAAPAGNTIGKITGMTIDGCPLGESVKLDVGTPPALMADPAAGVNDPAGTVTGVEFEVDIRAPLSCKFTVEGTSQFTWLNSAGGSATEFKIDGGARVPLTIKNPNNCGSLKNKDKGKFTATYTIMGPNPPVIKGEDKKKVSINPNLSPAFQRVLYTVVPYDGTTADHIPSYLQPFFSSTGWVCTSPDAKEDLTDYGFSVLPAGTALGDCGSLS